jgi:hypothetical protein
MTPTIKVVGGDYAVPHTGMLHALLHGSPTVFVGALTYLTSEIALVIRPNHHMHIPTSCIREKLPLEYQIWLLHLFLFIREFLPNTAVD